MKAQFNVSVDTTTIDDVRRRAREADVHVGDLSDLFMRFALAKMSVAAIREWAQKQQKGASVGPHSKNERLVLQAFAALPLKGGSEGSWRFALTDLAAEAGLRLTDAFWALKALQKRQLVHGMELEELDRWGRPVKSYWSLISAMPEARRPKVPQ